MNKPFIIEDEVGAILTPAGHWTLHPNAEIAGFTIDAAKRKKIEIEKKGIACKIAKNKQ